jgi:protein SCO1/2
VIPLLVLALATARLDEHVGAQLPRDVAFTDSTGAHVTLDRYFDGTRPVVLVLAYARCTMLCSVVLRGLADAVHDTPGDYLPVIVSLDPRETPDEAARRQDHLLLDAGRSSRDEWPYLVGDKASIDAVAETLGFHYEWDPDTEQYAHPAVVFVLTPDGRIAEYLRGVRYPDLADAIARARRGVLTTSAAQDLLTCFHATPALRRYGARVRALFELGAGTVFLGLVAMILWLRSLERRR